MRKKYLNLSTPSNEGHAGNANTGRVLSLEEEIAVLSDVADEQAKLGVDVAEATRVEDISDNLLNIADDAENIEELTPQQAALIDTAAEMAVAGTDEDPDMVIPSMEQYIGKRVSVEGLRETAKTIWENIRNFVISLWKRVVAMFQQLFSVMPRQQARIKALREAIALKKKAAGAHAPKSAVVHVVAGVPSISYPGHMVGNAKDLQSGLGDLTKLGNYVFSSYPKSVKKQGDVIAAELKGFDPLKPGSSLSAVRQKLLLNNFGDVPKSPATGYMGCFDLRVQNVSNKNPNLKDLSDAQVVNSLRHSSVRIESRVSAGATGGIQNRTFATMSIAEMESTLNIADNLIKSVLSYQSGSDYKGMEATRQAMIDGGNAANAAVAKAYDKPDTAATAAERGYAVDVMKGLMNFNTTYVGWTTNLPGEFIKKLLNAVKVSLVLVDKSLAQY